MDPTQPDSGIFTWKPQTGILLAFNFDVANHAASHQVYPFKWNYVVVSVSGGITFSLFAKTVINSVFGVLVLKEQKDKIAYTLPWYFKKSISGSSSREKGFVWVRNDSEGFDHTSSWQGFTPQGKQHPNNRRFCLFGFEEPLGMKRKTNKPTKRMWHSRMTLEMSGQHNQNSLGKWRKERRRYLQARKLGAQWEVGRLEYGVFRFRSST